MGQHPDRYTAVVDVCVMLRRADGWVLFSKRANTGFSDGLLGIPGGRLEAGESLTVGAARELSEEVGVQVDPDSLKFVHVAHHYGEEWGARLGFFFEADAWEGEPVNREPELCAGLHWVDLADLPDKTIPYVANVLTEIRAGKTLSLHGW
ncbi:NUDIX domain-containing protein [Streptomyces triculaminicus]|uniref:NUDIX domain-containing protein n=1 Tax=Streptomyces triculaminicus TaxID=2816232 RepID=A0A939JS38_9ACTN|nr:NUDIX domain-containing protein [Streptomyces triculaminicus]MBO0657238.1 NUDIX domain-containing protein [Streptomyces triculaminicus]